MAFENENYMRNSQRLLKVMLFIGGFVGASVVNAEACSYNEALMAFQQGNSVRGQALLSMAAKDGDQRAVRLLSALQEVFDGSMDYDGAKVMRMSGVAFNAE
jgi:hypothetical protein